MAITFTRAANATVADRALLSLSGLVSGLIHWNQTRRTRAALSQLSAHELEDIGLSKGDIDAIGGYR
jgi:uncharacterized protein YjiS (DUF1127 family)